MQIRVMTFNVRFDTPRDAPNTWDARRDAAIDVIRSYAPDVVGLQEPLEHQVRDIDERLDDYRCIGRARELGGGGEYVPLLYRYGRFDAEQSGVFWLSDTPDVEGSVGWDADATRISTWAVLRDHSTSRAFMIVNTHLDRWGQLAREESARVLLARASRFAGMPLVITGDMNAVEGDPPLEVVKAAMMRDSYRDIHDDAPPTIHHYGQRLGGKIDFVLCDPNWRVLDADVVRDRPAGRWPSDHYPVIADLELVEEPAG
jgi:endonuclease/exonuclease/phosphatase family metal-dependent hydrolase